MKEALDTKPVKCSLGRVLSQQTSVLVQKLFNSHACRRLHFDGAVCSCMELHGQGNKMHVGFAVHIMLTPYGTCTRHSVLGCMQSKLQPYPLYKNSTVKYDLVKSF